MADQNTENDTWKFMYDFTAAQTEAIAKTIGTTDSVITSKILGAAGHGLEGGLLLGKVITAPPGQMDDVARYEGLKLVSSVMVGTGAGILVLAVAPAAVAATLVPLTIVGVGDDHVSGGLGHDYILGSDGNDILDGGTGNDELNGGDGDDTATAGDGDDIVQAGAGTDTISAFENLTGSNYNDTLRGSTVANTIQGGAGNDFLYGDAGNDLLYGGTGNDTLYGDAGNDTLFGEAGTDTLYGGLGSDIFSFQTGGGVDVIKDFKATEGDKLDIRNILTGYDPLTKAITDFIQITTSGANSIVKIDANGLTGGTAWTQIATLENITGLTDEAALRVAGTIVA